MINSYPIWKYSIIILILAVGVIYALPSFYGKHPTICITQLPNNQTSDQDLFCIVKNVLKKENLIYTDIVLKSNKVIVKFFSECDQYFAYQKLFNIFSDTNLVSYGKEIIFPNWLSTIYAKPIKLGLDLCGGVYLSVYVDTEFVLNKFQDEYVDMFKYFLNKKFIPYLKIFKIEHYGIKIIFSDCNYKNQAYAYLPKLGYDIILNSIGENELNIFFSKNYLNKISEYAIQHNSVVLSHRIYQLGITEALVRRHGMNYLSIEIPGVQDIKKIKDIISVVTELEFRVVNTTINTSEIDKIFIPEDSEIKLMDNGYSVPLYKKVILTGDSIVHSSVSFDEYGFPQVNLMLSKIGSSIISEFTKNNVGKVIAILFTEYQDSGKKDMKGHTIFVKNEKIINIATVQSQISSDFRITGIIDIDKARRLSLLLRMGSLKSPIFIEEERIIGPTLGQKNIEQGFIACFLGVLVSICFMMFWYRFFGLIASFALIMNFMLIISIISLIPGMVLTMSSIASIILTLSVAIDANVLINERVKEEIKQGKPIQYAIYVGYRKVFNSIVDANITTIITSVILYLLIGAESVQGFAITTIIGVLTSMFTSIFGTRAIVNLVYGRKKNVDKLSI